MKKWIYMVYLKGKIIWEFIDDEGIWKFIDNGLFIIKCCCDVLNEDDKII